MLELADLTNLVIGSSTISIGAALFFISSKIRQQFPRVATLFGAFFVFAGLARLLRSPGLFQPEFKVVVDALDVLTSIAAFCTAVSIWPLAFRSLRLPSYPDMLKLNRELTGARQLFQSFMDHIPALAIIRNKEGKIRFVNKAFEESTGISRQEIENQYDVSLFQPKDLEIIRQSDSEVLRTRKALEYVARMQIASGEEKSWMVIKFPVTTEREALIGSVSVDLTQLVTAERSREEAQRKIEELNKELTERVRQLDEINQALETARDAAVSASSLKSSFVANISHELRTPLTGIIGMNELLMETELTEEQQSMAEIVQESARVLLAVVNDILDLAKIEAGKITLDASAFNTAQLIDDCAKLLAPSATRKNILLEVVVDPKIPPCLYGDLSRLKQILLNLIGNAVKFTEQGRIEVRASLVEKSTSRAIVTFSVTDTGIGIRDEDQQLLFTPFTQVDSSSTRKHGGTGLGLVITKRLIEMMGCAIRFESKPGRGSRFWFKVPFDRRHVEAVSGDIEAVTRTGPINPRLARNRKVLLVEDSIVLVELALRQLAALGVDADAVSTGAEAVERALSGEYNAVLMDVNLPDISGHQAATTIRATEYDEGRSPIPIIAMTASAMKGDRERALQSGMTDYLSKPVDLDKLKAALEQAFSEAAAESNGHVELPMIPPPTATDQPAVSP